MTRRCCKENMPTIDKVLCPGHAVSLNFNSTCTINCQSRGFANGYCQDGWNCRCMTNKVSSGGDADIEDTVYDDFNTEICWDFIQKWIFRSDEIYVLNDDWQIQFQPRKIVGSSLELYFGFKSFYFYSFYNNINNFLSWSPPTSLVVWVQRFEFSPGGWHVIVQVVATTPTLLGEKIDKTVKVSEERFGPNLGISWRLENKLVIWKTLM